MNVNQQPLDSAPAQKGHGVAAGAWAFAVSVALAPFVLVVVKVAQYGLYFPYWDELRLIPFIEKSRAGALTFVDLWSQHNEHRLFFPRVIMLTLAWLTHWNVAYELGVSIVLAAGLVAVLLWLARGTARAVGRPMTPWLLPAFSFLVFSWAQMENWVWGWQLQVFLSTLAVAGGIALLSGGTLSWWRFTGAILMGVVAAYSFANGLLYWFVALPAVVSTPGASRRMRLMRLEVWAVAALLIIESYLFAYVKPSLSAGLVNGMRVPHDFLLQCTGGGGAGAPFASLPGVILAYAGYLVLYLGGPLTGLVAEPAWHGAIWPVKPLEFVPGALGVAAFAWCAYRLLRTRGVPFVALAPWFALSAQALGSAVITCAGRINAGVGYAFMSRYMTIALLFWCALAVLVAAYRDAGRQRAQAPSWRRALGIAAGVAFVAAAQFLFVHNNRDWEDTCRWKRMGWEAILAGYEAPTFLNDLCWDGEEMRTQYLPALKRLRLCGFEKEPSRPPARAGAYLHEARFFIETGRWIPAATYLEAALFFDPSRQDARDLLAQVMGTIEELRRKGPAGRVGNAPEN